MVAAGAERFSQYGLTILLVLYLTEGAGLSVLPALGIFAVFCALRTVGVILAGFVSDRLIGARWTAFAGIGMFSAGNGFLAVSASDSAMLEVFFAGLGAAALGSGLLRCASAVMIGRIYEAHDPRRSDGFMAYCVCLAITAAAAPMACGYIASLFGWSAAFTTMALVASTAAVTLAAGQSRLSTAIARDPREQRTQDGWLRWALAVAAMTAGLALSYELLHHPEVLNALAAGLGSCAAAVAGLLFATRPAYRPRLILIATLFGVSVAFTALISAYGGTVSLFVRDHVVREVAGLQFPASAMPSFEVMFLVALYFWLPYLRRVFPLNLPAGAFGRLALGVFAGAAGCLTLVAGTWATPAGAQMALAWLMLFYLLIAVMELVIPALGLSLLTQLGRNRSASLVACWSVGGFYGHLLAGWLARITLGPPTGAPSFAAVDFQLMMMAMGLGLGAAAALLAFAAPRLATWLKRETDAAPV
jgi:POT family proton-dependent oligopeptide transporter